ncbi:MAG: NADH-quinone oxidoreductase subunit C [Candidatus Heimdallarchaeota archaeon]|nr:MAG: NADH-quinone oxidoreductase subunit C [Candidatus Heimdallarchaeota archaeon]
MTDIESHVNQLKETFGTKLEMVEIVSPTRIRLRVHVDDIEDIMQFIASELNFTSLETISGVDYETYFEVVYHLDRWDGDATVIQVHVKIEDRETPTIPSVTPIWGSANWHERELYDLFGIKVENHPNLKRLLLPEEWDEYEHKHISELHPMRRDYQLPEKPFSFKPQEK